jgi:beta-glucosidase
MSFSLKSTNPSGKHPLTFPRRLKDNPTYLNIRSERESGRVLYGEDVYVGYQYYEQTEVPSLVSFGHGLSYTAFSLSNLEVQTQSHDQMTVRCTLTNTGSRMGAGVVQVYIATVLPPARRNVKN